MKVNIVIMGQSGNGKSTIVNAIMGKKVAETGKGGAVTTKNQMYSTSYILDGTSYELNLYDTVGLELSEATTRSTLKGIEKQLQKARRTASLSNINIVWFCINNRSSRFQDFEVDLIRKLSYEYEIPFVIVMTQCFDNQIGELETLIRSEMPEIPTVHILAEDYKLRGGAVISAFGLDDLLKLSIKEYTELKVQVLESKLNDIQKQLDISEWHIKQYEDKAKGCIEEYVEQATKIGWVPGGCIPVVHGLCIKMINKLHTIYGISSNKGIAEEIFADAVVGVIVTPMMAIPILSAAVAYAYVSSIGESYMKTLSEVMKESKYSDLNNQKLMAERIKQQINQNKGR